MNEVVVDGDYLEGGGQILRISVAVSSVRKINVKIEKIRYNRKVPGLQQQHLCGVRLLRRICQAKCVGEELKSVTLRFIPARISGGEYEEDSKTAGSVCLVVQAVLPALLFADSPTTLFIKGGTDADFAPPVDYFKEVVAFYLAKMGISMTVDVVQRGFYPKGGGEIRVMVDPTKDCIGCVDLTKRGDITGVKASCFVAGNVPLSVAEEMQLAIVAAIKKHQTFRHLLVDMRVYKEEPSKAFGNGFGCMLTVDTSGGCKFGFNIVGKREFSGAHMGSAVVNQFVKLFDESQACVDNQMQDQMLIFMALAKGHSVIRSSRPTQHSKTGIYVLEKLLPVKFEIERVGDVTEDVLISCEGAAVSIKDHH